MDPGHRRHRATHQGSPGATRHGTRAHAGGRVAVGLRPAGLSPRRLRTGSRSDGPRPPQASRHASGVAGPQPDRHPTHHHGYRGFLFDTYPAMTSFIVCRACPMPSSHTARSISATLFSPATFSISSRVMSRMNPAGTRLSRASASSVHANGDALVTGAVATAGSNFVLARSVSQPAPSL